MSISGARKYWWTEELLLENKGGNFPGNQSGKGGHFNVTKELNKRRRSKKGQWWPGTVLHAESIVEHEYLCNVNELDRQIASSYHSFISVCHIVEWPAGQEYVRFMLNLLTCVYIVETLSQNVQNYEKKYIF